MWSSLVQLVVCRERKGVLKALLSTMEGHPPPEKRPCHAGDLERPVAPDTAAGSSLEDREDNASGNTEHNTSSKMEDTLPKFGKRKKFAALISYSGSGYSGMQK